MTSRLSMIVLSSLLLSACLKAQFAPSHTSYVPQPKVNADDIEVYRTEKPARPFEEIGTVYVPSIDLLKATAKLKAQVAKNGGDAIIDIKVTSDGIAGTAIRYK